MPSTNARRSKRHEREIVRAAEDAGLTAERAWNSNGRSLGEHEECDVRLETVDGTSWTVQAKRRKTVAGYLTTENADVVVTRQDHGENLAVVPFDLFLDLLRNA
jgi:Holliday junction resolvase